MKKTKDCGMNVILLFVTQVILLNKLSFAFDHVVELTDESIEKTINLPQTNLWMVVFYAPWCQHSKSFLHLLDDVAPTLKDQMAIGRIDCTNNESICDKYEIQGYPTLKWYRDGVFQDYNEGRKHDEIISFASRLNSPIMKVIDNHKELLERSILDYEEVGATFVFYHLFTSSNYDHKANEDLKTLMTTARQFQAKNRFIALESNEKNQEWVKSLLPSSYSKDNVLIKFELGTRPKVFRSDWSSLSLEDFIKQNNEVTVPMVHAMNIHTFGLRNKYVAIAILDLENKHQDSTTFLSAFHQFATTSSLHIRNNYQFAWIDGSSSKDFLDKFSISLQDSPQLFVLDYPHDIYWENKHGSSLNIHDLNQKLSDIIKGEIMGTHLNAKNAKVDTMTTYSTFVWSSENTWAFNIHIFFSLVGLALLMPKSAGKLHEYLELYLWRGCIDPILGLAQEDRHNNIIIDDNKKQD